MLKVNSVEAFFNGDIKFLKDIKNAVNIPVMQKDFIISKKQILQGMSHGSDAFLLIAEALNYNDLADLYNLGLNEKLETLVEIHDRKNLLAINELSPTIVGVNCRNLKKMELDFSRFERFFPKLPKDSLKVAELKEMCIREGLSRSGNKSELIERLRSQAKSR